jgi:cytochrome c-type biogenesis protein CcmH/NrfG
MSDEKRSIKTGWTSVQVYAMSVLCLIAGVTVGYLVRGSTAAQAADTSASGVSQTQMTAMSGAQAGVPPNVTPEQMTPDQMKRMAEKQVAPLLEQLAKNPNDTDALIKVGGYYFAAQQFDVAVTYYEKAANIKQTADVLTKLSNAQFYAGAREQAIVTLNRALQIDPKFANALYNLGFLKWQVQGDMKGAIASWEKLLKVTDPNNPNRAGVEKMIERAKEHEKISAGNKKIDKPAM